MLSLFLVQILVVVAIILFENTEDRSGVGFHVNSTWTWVSRSQPPRKSFLGKVGEPSPVRRWWNYSFGSGEREFGPGFRNRRVGNGRKAIEALKQLTTAGRQGSLACGELSFSLTQLTL